MLRAARLFGRANVWALIDELGVPEAAKEAVLFALIGFLSVLGLESSIASCTGARHGSVLGAITPGRQPMLAVSASEAPISLVVELPLAMMVTPAVPARTAAEFIALAKAHPGQMSYSSSGAGSAPHLAAEIFKDRTGTF